MDIFSFCRFLKTTHTRVSRNIELKIESLLVCPFHTDVLEIMNNAFYDIIIIKLQNKIDYDRSTGKYENWTRA